MALHHYALKSREECRRSIEAMPWISPRIVRFRVEKNGGYECLEMAQYDP
jgi:hypothetical protein